MRERRPCVWCVTETTHSISWRRTRRGLQLVARCLGCNKSKFTTAENPPPKPPRQLTLADIPEGDNFTVVKMEL